MLGNFVFAAAIVLPMALVLLPRMDAFPDLSSACLENLSMHSLRAYLSYLIGKAIKVLVSLFAICACTSVYTILAERLDSCAIGAAIVLPITLVLLPWMDGFLHLGTACHKNLSMPNLRAYLGYLKRKMVKVLVSLLVIGASAFVYSVLSERLDSCAVAVAIVLPMALVLLPQMDTSPYLSKMVNIVLHHEGELNFACGDYKGGQVTHLRELDPDFISVMHLHKLLREELGYKNFEGLWCKFEGEPFESAINSLDSDADVIRILKRLEKDKLDTLHVYVEHSLDLPDIIPVDAQQIILCTVEPSQQPTATDGTVVDGGGQGSEGLGGGQRKGASNDVGGNENRDEVCYVMKHFCEQNFKQWLHENSLFDRQRKILNPQFLQILRDVLRCIGNLHQVENRCHGNLSELNIVIVNGRGKITGMVNDVTKKCVDDYLSLAAILRDCFRRQRQTIPTELELLLRYISTTEPSRLLNIEHHPSFLSPLQRLCYRVIAHTFLYFGKKKKSFELKLNEKLSKYNWKRKVRTFRMELNRRKSFLKCLSKKQMKSLQYNKSATSFMRFGRNIVVHLADIVNQEVSQVKPLGYFTKMESSETDR